MKKRRSRPIATTLLTTALLGIGVLPALANPPSILDDLNGDVFLQSVAGGSDVFTLNVNNAFIQSAVIPGSGPDAGANANIGLTTGYLTDSAGNPKSDPFYMFCVDFKDDITLPVSYNVIIQGLETTPNPNGLSPEQLQAMQEQALLGANFGDGSAAPALDTATAAQFDIWNLDGNGSLANIPVSTLMQTLLDAAVTAQGQPTADFSNDFLFDISGNPNVTPPNPDAPNSPGQAFMPLFTSPGNNSNSGTPEPGTLAMLGLGLIGLGSLKLRSRRAK